MTTETPTPKQPEAPAAPTPGPRLTRALAALRAEREAQADAATLEEAASVIAALRGGAK